MLNRSLPLAIHYQPIVDLRHACVVGYEALARFPAEIGMPPDECIRAANKCGKRLELEEFLFSESLSARSQLPPNCFLSVNVSPVLLFSSGWEELLDTAGRLDRVVIEITENDLMADLEGINARVEGIRARGGMSGLDDLGSGYSSLRHLMELKPEFVKIDRLFVQECHLDRAKAVIIEMVGKASDRLDAWIVAEGVETAEELQELMRLGVPLAQGFYLGRPNEEMLQLEEERSAELALNSVPRCGGETIEGCLEACEVRGSREEAMELVRMGSEITMCVIADQWKRPQGFVEMHPVGGLRDVSRLMKVQAASSPNEVLQRALTRDAASRFDPILGVDELGRFQGVLRLDRLMGGILAAGEEGGKGR